MTGQSDRPLALPGPAGGRGAGTDHSLVPAAVRLGVLPDATGRGGQLHPAADPHRRPVLQRDRLHHGELRRYHRRIRDRPGRAHDPDARRPGPAGRRRTRAAGGGAPRPATTIRHQRRRWPGHHEKTCPGPVHRPARAAYRWITGRGCRQPGKDVTSTLRTPARTGRSPRCGNAAAPPLGERPTICPIHPGPEQRSRICWRASRQGPPAYWPER